MSKLYVPKDYVSKLSVRDTQRAIKFIKDTFQINLANELQLDRVTAPIIVTKESGINDDLNGVERKVSFTMKEIEGEGEVVQSLAKWKRKALHDFGYVAGEGIYTDMNAIRRDDDVDNIHSIFVDQWDWEKIITREQRTTEYLCKIVRSIVKILAYTKQIVKDKYPVLQYDICPDVFFITSQELEDMYPDMTAKERENEITRKYRSVFIMQIGNVLKSGKRHDGRAPDYDDWSLNGDLLIWNDVLESALEVSSMGIRVDSASLLSQLEKADALDRKKFEYHSNIINDVYPLTIGGGIGQSRICMLILEKAHIGEVHSSIWPNQLREECKSVGINLL